MAGEIEEPFTLDFRVDSFGSGSVSFGRFEKEALCWERRSSFLHNRYLEEVEKCSTPGFVIQKKAYFEAHFRKKKGLPLLTSPECPHNKDNENETSEVMCADEDIDHKNASAQSLDGLDNNKRVDKTQKNSSTSKPEKIKPRLVPRVSPSPSRKYSPGTTPKGSVNKAIDKVRDDRVRCKAEKKTSEDPHKTLNLKHRVERSRTRSRTSVEPQHSMPTKVSGGAYQTANRVKPARQRLDISKSTRKEAEPSNTQARKHRAGSSIPGTRSSKTSQSQSAGMDQTTSTSTAPTTKVKASQTGISRKKEPEKEKQKARINERSSYASFNRAGRVAVGVVS